MTTEPASTPDDPPRYLGSKAREVITNLHKFPVWWCRPEHIDALEWALGLAEEAIRIKQDVLPEMRNRISELENRS